MCYRRLLSVVSILVGLLKDEAQQCVQYMILAHNIQPGSFRHGSNYELASISSGLLYKSGTLKIIKRTHGRSGTNGQQSQGRYQFGTVHTTRLNGKKHLIIQSKEDAPNFKVMTNRPDGPSERIL